jgi:hypothetical protein
MHIPEIRLLCVAYADSLYFEDADVIHLTECPECYGRWKLFLQDVRNWRTGEAAKIGQMFPPSMPPR